MSIHTHAHTHTRTHAHTHTRARAPARTHTHTHARGHIHRWELSVGIVVVGHVGDEVILSRQNQSRLGIPPCASLVGDLVRLQGEVGARTNSNLSDGAELVRGKPIMYANMSIYLSLSLYIYLSIYPYRQTDIHAHIYAYTYIMCISICI